MKRRLALISLLALTTVLLIAPVREAIVMAVVRPVLYSAWLLGLVYQSVPQLLIWAVFLSLAVLLALYTLARPARRSGRRPSETARYSGRVELLAKWIGRASADPYFRQKMTQHLDAVMAEVMAYRYGAGTAAATGRPPTTDSGYDPLVTIQFLERELEILDGDQG